MKQFFKKSTETIAGMVVGGIAVLTLSSAFAFTLPYTFSNGTPADATQVNANFNALKDNMASPTLVSNGTIEIGALLGFQGSSYSGMTNQGYLFQINNSGALTTISTAVPITSSTTLQARWDAAIDSFEQLLLNNIGVSNNGLRFSDGTLYFDSACTVTTVSSPTPTSSLENTTGTYVTVPSIPPKHVFKIPDDTNVYVFTGTEPTFNAASVQTFSFTPYFKTTTNGSGASYCNSLSVPASLGMASCWNAAYGYWDNCSGSMVGTVPVITTISTLLNGGPYFQTYPTNVNNQATTGIPNIGFAAPISIEMR
ncbi:MAG: hypothetical protein HQL81_15840 [Magnetococcales bacterium]|nr:hypothetical protein [Magnetococcales bacterium]